MASFVSTNTKAWLAGYDISADLNKVAVAYGAELKDGTAFGDSARNMKGGLKTLAAAIEGFFNAGTDAIDEVLYNRIATADVPLTFGPTTGAEGERAFTMLANLARYVPRYQLGELAGFSADAEASGVLVRGMVLVNGTKTATFNGTAFNLGKVPGIRTNGWTYSEDLTQSAYTKTRSSITANALPGPRGFTTLDKIVEDNTASNTHFVLRDAPALTDNEQQAISFYAKAGERTWIAIDFTDKAGTGHTAYFNLSTGAVGTTGAASAEIEAVGNGLYRCKLIPTTSASGATTPFVRIFLATADNTNSYTGDGTSGAYVGGLQFEADKSFVGDYIFTEGATASLPAKKIYAAAHVLGPVLGSSPTLDLKLQSDNGQGMASPADRITFSQMTARGALWGTPASGEITDDWWRIVGTIGGSSGPSFPTVVVAGIL